MDAVSPLGQGCPSCFLYFISSRVAMLQMTGLLVARAACLSPTEIPASLPPTVPSALQEVPVTTAANQSSSSTAASDAITTTVVQGSLAAASAAMMGLSTDGIVENLYRFSIDLLPLENVSEHLIPRGVNTELRSVSSEGYHFSKALFSVNLYSLKLSKNAQVHYGDKFFKYFNSYLVDFNLISPRDMSRIGGHFVTSPHKKFQKSRVVYYSKCTASFNPVALSVVRSGDIHPHPGPHRQCNPTCKSAVRHDSSHKKCKECDRTIARNHHATICDCCSLWSHIKCGDSQFMVTGYRMSRADRNIHGGGLLVYIRADLCLKVIKDLPNLRLCELERYKTESIVLKVRIAKKWETIVGIYRPPTSASVPQSLWKFELSSILEAITILPGNCSFVGDFNSDMLLPDKPPRDGRVMANLLDIYDLKNLIHEATRHRNQEYDLRTILKEHDVVITDKKQMAELFSSYFVNIADGVPEITEQSYGKELDAHPSIQAIFNNNEQLAVRNKFAFQYTNKTQVEALLLKINSRKSCGHDGIQPQLDWDLNYDDLLEKAVLKPGSYWNSDTLDAIAEFGSTFFINTIKYQCSWALPENINILGANINLSKADRQKILNCHKSSKKMDMAVKRKMSYAQLEPPKEKKCLNMCSQYYKNKKAKTLTDCAEKNQSMEAMKNKIYWLKKKAYQNMGSCEKDKLPEKQRTLTSKAKQTKPLKCNVLDSCINPFQNKIKEGPSYIGVGICGRYPVPLSGFSTLFIYQRGRDTPASPLIDMNKQLCIRIQEGGFQVDLDPPRDGDCFYHAAAHQLGINCKAAKNRLFSFLESNRIDAFAEVTQHQLVIITENGDNNYVKVIEPEGLSVGTLYFGHGGDPSHYVALRPAHMRRCDAIPVPQGEEGEAYCPGVSVVKGKADETVHKVLKIRKSFRWAVKMSDLADGKDAASPFFNVERSTLRFIWARNSTPQKFMLEQLVSSMPLTISLR
ncbi:hypothetical protein pdam_00024287 [Pocillopora damicornis]|uniref:OTU domain-containing protein n=1 Tax=Pocillopora damicornis TaxID=46731 RepID=A0A3M6TWY3_POCDA|nr:hypothetical protein pdam_00024287 [Pocillopora damicornis]